MRADGAPIFQELRKLANNVTLAWTIEREDGEVLGFTASDLEFTYLGVTYKPSNGLTGMAAVQKNDLSVANASAQGLLTMEVTEDDMLNGLYDNAVIKLFWIDPTDPGKGTIAIQGGRVGEIKVTNNQFEAELRSFAQKLQQGFGDLYTLDCSANLGDAKCGVQLIAFPWTPNTNVTAISTQDAKLGTYIRPTAGGNFWFKCIQSGKTGTTEPTWAEGEVADGTARWTSLEKRIATGTVTHVFNEAIFSDVNRYEDPFVYDNGLLTWLTGDNAGTSIEVRNFSGQPRTFTLLEAMTRRIRLGDTYEVTVGCQKTTQWCNKFGNILNFRGFPFMPTEEKALETPNYSSQGKQKEEPDSGGIS